jgi:type IV pilus assembly protein PilB
MGIEPFLVASGIECVVAQRLARRLCDCKEPAKISTEQLHANGFHADEDLDAFEPGGCVRCAGTGYKGRVGLYEVMTVTDEVRSLILDKVDGNTIREVALQEGMRAMRQDAIEKVGVGVTSVEEVLRALGTAQA